jgi:protein required for attachment to host cells
MPGFRVLVADTAHAKFFELEAPGEPLRHTESVANPYTGKHDRDLGTDAPGHVMSRQGDGARRTALQPRHSHKQHATEQFARLLAERLTTAAHAHPHDRFVLVIAPRFLSEVRARLPDMVRQRVIRELKRDLVDMPRLDLQARVATAIRPRIKAPPSSASMALRRSA